MNAREAMQALLDGKTLYQRTTGCGRVTCKLDSEGVLRTISEGGLQFGNNLNVMEGIYEEYPLTFEQALRAMLDGKVVKSEGMASPIRFNHYDGVFQYLNSDDWRGAYISRPQQREKWKVVE